MYIFFKLRIRTPLLGFAHYAGIVHGGGFYLLGVQTLAVVCCIIYPSIATYILISVSEPRFFKFHVFLINL